MKSDVAKLIQELIEKSMMGESHKTPHRSDIERHIHYLSDTEILTLIVNIRFQKVSIKNLIKEIES